MLNRSKVMRELREKSNHLFMDNSHSYNVARALWEKVVKDPTIVHKVNSIRDQAPWLLPSWHEPLNTCVALDHSIDAYQVLAVDGSQVYPDRHQGTSCFLINIGSVVLNYGIPGKSVHFETEPFVFFSHEYDFKESPTEIVNCKRQELEFVAGVRHSKIILEQKTTDDPFIFLFDGSLIFWHLESKDIQLKTTFLGRYLVSLYQLAQAKVLTAGYISLPKNKELINILRLAHTNFDIQASQDFKEIDSLVDTDIAHFFLPPFSRTTTFKNHAKISQLYPENVHPYFFYLNVGSEIGRVEIPAWIAHDTTLVDCIAKIICDQSVKGRGYPVAIAESHEQAVIKGPDREFFYQLITKIGFELNKNVPMSQKSIKKRGLSI